MNKENTNNANTQNPDELENDRKFVSQLKDLVQLAITTTRKGISFITETISSSDHYRKAMNKDNNKNALI